MWHILVCVVSGVFDYLSVSFAVKESRVKGLLILAGLMIENFFLIIWFF